MNDDKKEEINIPSLDPVPIHVKSQASTYQNHPQNAGNHVGPVYVQMTQLSNAGEQQMLQPHMIGPHQQGPQMRFPQGYYPTGPEQSIIPNGQNGGYGPGGQLNQRFQTMSRFEGDNKGLEKLNQVQNPSVYENSQVCLGKCSAWFGTYFPCCCCTNPYQTVKEGFSGIILRYGKFYKLVGPGMHYLIPDVDRLVVIDKREKVMELKRQTVVSLDNTSFNIDAVIYYKVINTYKSNFAVANLTVSLLDLASTTLRNAVGRLTMQQFLELREHLAEQIEQEIAHATESWGIKVMRVLVQDVFLPTEFQNSFSSGAVAKRISEAQVITSKAEVEVARLMKDAAEALNTEAAFQIRYISALEAIANSHNPKLIFFPADYNEVGGANDHLISEINEEYGTLLRKT